MSSKEAADLKIASSVIQGLERDGVVRQISRVQYRNPFAGKFEQTGIQRTLTEEQKNAVDGIWDEYAQGIRKTYLLEGVTGSGKTEVYMELISRVIAEGKQAIVLIPEIALTFQTVRRFYERFGDRVSVMHSRLSEGERYDQFLRAKAGEIDVMIGPRSALFTPFSQIGVIIIDEEHEGAYKSETVPRYDAREVAAVRELTKKFEEVRRATIGEHLRYFSENPPKGEFVLVCEGFSLEAQRQAEREGWESISVEEHVAKYVAEGMSEKDAMKQAAKDRGVSKREIYQILKNKRLLPLWRTTERRFFRWKDCWQAFLL